jgi:WD40 repeat protein
MTTTSEPLGHGMLPAKRPNVQAAGCIANNETPRVCRLWDLRKLSGGGSSKALRLYKGNQNTFTNFIRVSLAPHPTLVMSGSEDGYCYLWDRLSGSRVQRLGGFNTIIYSAAWSQRHSLIATSAHDGVVRTWWYNDKVGRMTRAFGFFSFPPALHLLRAFLLSKARMAKSLG